jgi:predicted extracellular nuclease
MTMSGMDIRFGLRVVAALATLLGPALGHAQISYTGGTYVQNFDTLPATGTYSLVGPGPHSLASAPVNAAGLPGWSFGLVPGSTAADARFTVGSGTTSSGSVFSYGSVSQTERALGTLASASVISRFGAILVNDTPNVITRVSIFYTGEQWRYGGSSTVNSLRFSYGIGASSLDEGQFTDVSGLTFVSPVTAGPTGALNGNLAANRTLLSGTLSGLSWAPGQTLVVRWTDENESGNDNGLAIDDLVLTTDAGTGPLEITSTTPATGSAAAYPNSAIAIHFNHPTTAAGAWYQVVGSLSGVHQATVSGPPTSHAIRPTTEFEFGETVTVTLFASGIVDQNTGQNLPADHTLSFSIVAAPAVVTRIHDVQGASASSPLVGGFVTIQGVVTGVFQNTTTGLHGFFVQEQETEYDGDPETSEGVFVFDDGSAPSLAQGDLVTVTGVVAEFDELTELAPVASVRVVGAAPLPAAISILLPLPATAILERYEGMRVMLPQTLAVTRNELLGSGGEVELTFGLRLAQPTNVVAPGSAAVTRQIQNDLNRILLDDGNRQVYPDPTPYLLGSGTLRAGDRASGIGGVLTQFGGAYHIEPTAPIAFMPANLRPPQPPPVGGRVRVVAANVLNYFNGDGLGGGFPTARGASNAAELARQREKILTKLTALGADVYGLTEVENDGYGANSAIRDLVNGLNAHALGGTTYRYVFAGFGLGGDLIRCALIYREQTIEPIGPPATTTTAPFNANRPPLAQTFREIATGEKFTVVVNHFRSKGGAGTGLDADQGDGQGVFNHLRTQQAQVLVDWLATDPTGSGDPDFLIVGDLNSYAKEDPVTTIRNAGFVNLIERFEGEGGYSFTFGGQWGHLDYALGTPRLTDQVTSAETWHVNADEPDILDYNLENKSPVQQTLNAGTAFRASDHDPILIGLNLAPALSYADWASGIAWPDGADSSPSGDPDGDGLANAIEFVLNSDPLASSIAERPSFVTNGSAAEFVYRRRKNGGAIVLLVESSADLQNWFPVGPGTRIGEANPETDLYSLSLPLDAEKLFLRLRVTMP